MRLEKLVEQHCVHRLVAHSVKVAFGIAGYQIGINFLHLLGYEAELPDALAIKLRRVAEGNRPERQEHVAAITHCLDVLLETSRGDARAEMAECIDVNQRSVRDRCPINNGEINGGVSSCGADAD